MIQLTDSLTLALTKLRTRKVRTVITIIISGLLFGLICFIILTTTGLTNSLDRLSKSGLGERYILAVQRIGDMGSSVVDEEKVYSDQKLVRDIEHDYKSYIDRKSARAKELSVAYEAKTEDPNPIVVDNKSGKKSIDPSLADQSTIVAKHLADYQKRNVKKLDIKSLADEFHPIAYPNINYVMPGSDNLADMVGGKESTIVNFGKPENKDNSDPFGSLNAGEFSSLMVADDSLVLPFASQSFDAKSADAIPVVVPHNYAEKSLGLKTLGKRAPTNERLDRIKEVRQKATSLHPSLCYRNSASQQQLEDALTQQKDIKKHQNDRDYQAPEVLYNIPRSDSCAAVTVAKDNRPAEEANQAKLRQQLEEEFNPSLKPVQHKLNFKVIGVAPSSASMPDGFSVAEVVSLLFSGTNSDSWTIPQKYLDELPAKLRPADVFSPDQSANPTQGSYDDMMYNQKLVEFASRQDAQNFKDKYECSLTNCDDNSLVTSSYGSNSFIVDQIRNASRTAIKWLLGIVGVFAAIILTSVVGRVIADGRRETAVFRAIGAKRRDINAIYVTYTVLLALCIVAFVLLFGTVFALIVQIKLSPQITPSALVAFGAEDLSQTVSLFSMASTYMLLLPAVIIAASLVAIILPLLMNMRRNPINDMRQE